jgi:hypothetical protein
VPRERSILLLGANSPLMSELADRISDLAYRCVSVETPDDAIEVAREQGLEYGVALSEPARRALEWKEALDSIRLQSNSRHMRYIATGDQPDEQICARLRESGAGIALWAPVEDHALRFHLNALMSESREVLLRRESRAPIDVSATVCAGGRRKQVAIYCLSAGGAFLETTRPSRPGANLEITLQSPDGELSVDAHVLYTNVPGNLSQPTLPMGMGVQFENLGRSALDAIRQIVEFNTVALTI